MNRVDIARMNKKIKKGGADLTATLLTAAPLLSDIVEIPIDKIEADPEQPRKTFSEKSIAELAESIREHGVMQNIGVRLPAFAVGDDHAGPGYVLVFGERRLRAARLVGLETIPARIYHVRSWREAIAMQLIENTHREDVSPLEEADRYVTAKERGESVESMAALSGKSVAYVYQRLALANLSERSRDALARKQITIDAANEVSKLPVETQDSLLEDIIDPINEHRLTQEAVRRIIRETRLLPLASAPFDTGAPFGGIVACSQCPKRTQAQAELFAIVTKDDSCTDPGCYRAKVDAAWRELKKTTPKKVIDETETAKLFEHSAMVVSKDWVDESERYWDAEWQKYRTWADVGAEIEESKKGIAQEPRTGRLVTLLPRAIAERVKEAISKGRPPAEIKEPKAKKESPKAPKPEPTNAVESEAEAEKHETVSAETVLSPKAQKAQAKAAEEKAAEIEEVKRMLCGSIRSFFAIGRSEYALYGIMIRAMVPMRATLERMAARRNDHGEWVEVDERERATGATATVEDVRDMIDRYASGALDTSCDLSLEDLQMLAQEIAVEELRSRGASIPELQSILSILEQDA